jgi:hypothetical protein
MKIICPEHAFRISNGRELQNDTVALSEGSKEGLYHRSCYLYTFAVEIETTFKGRFLFCFWYQEQEMSLDCYLAW